MSQTWMYNVNNIIVDVTKPYEFIVLNNHPQVIFKAGSKEADCDVWHFHRSK